MTPDAQAVRADLRAPSEADQPDRDWEAEATKWKPLARKHEKAAKDNADAARRLAGIEESGKSEQERLAEARQAADERASAAEREAARLRVALRKGLTDVQAKRLVGDTEEELEADADELLATFAPAQVESDTDLPHRREGNQPPRRRGDEGVSGGVVAAAVAASEERGVPRVETERFACGCEFEVRRPAALRVATRSTACSVHRRVDARPITIPPHVMTRWAIHNSGYVGSE